MPRPRPVELLAASPLWDDFDGGTVVVACSGGRDSTALSLAMAELLADPAFCARFSAPVELVVWHLDHGLRQSSSLDASFVQRLAAELGAECIVETAQLAELLEKSGGNTEEVARTERYRRLIRLVKARAADSPHNLDAVALTAHHLADQAETVLFNLVRGSHLAGLRGIAPVKEDVIHRPWLRLDPQRIEEYLAQRDQAYLDDPTNQDVNFTRNKLRHQVVPVLEEINPRALAHISRLADTAGTAFNYITGRLQDLPVESFTQRAIDRWLPLVGWPRGGYDAFRLNAGWDGTDLAALFCAAELIKRLGSLNAAEHDELSRWAIRPVEPAVIRGWRVNQPHHRVLAIASPVEQGDDTPRLLLEPGRSSPIGGLDVEMRVPGEHEWDRRQGDGPEPWERLSNWPRVLDEMTATPPRRPAWHCFLDGGVKLPLTLRAWSNGDRIQLTGGGTKKLGDVFTDAKLPACFRQVWGVLADAGGEILWVPGVCDSRRMQLGPGVKPAYVVSIRESGG